MIEGPSAGILVERQMGLPGWSEMHQAKVSGAQVLVAGVGGVGGVVAQYLAMGGVGSLYLVHHGPLDWPDLNRQTLMERSGIGKSRVTIAAERLIRQVPECRILALDSRLDPWMESLVASSDLVVDARTNFEERFLLNKMAAKAKKPLVFAAMNGMEGLVLPMRPGQGACLRCLFAEGDPEWDPLGFPVLGAVSGAVGSMAAIVALRMLSGYGEDPEGAMTVFDGTDLSLRTVRVARRPDCPVCQAVDEKTGF